MFNQKPETRNQKLIYDGSFKGFTTVLELAFRENLTPEDILSEKAESPQDSLFEEKQFVETDEKAQASFLSKIKKEIHADAANNILGAFLSEEPGMELKIFEYLRFGFEKKALTDNYLTDDRVKPILDARHRTAFEAHRFKGFVRFEEIEGGIYYARIEPDYNILELLALHFKQRLGAQDWVIHDAKRGTALIYDRKTRAVEVKEVEGVEFEHSREEKDYRAMWKKYFDAMGIKERLNPRLQGHFVPKKYRKNMHEFK